MKNKSLLLAKAIVNSAEKEIGFIPPDVKAHMIIIYAQGIESIPKGMKGGFYIRCRNTGKIYRTSVAA